MKSTLVFPSTAQKPLFTSLLNSLSRTYTIAGQEFFVVAVRDDGKAPTALIVELTPRFY